MTKRSKYRYYLNDYHAIKKADIILDGITVLTGVNGSGKSTLSRWLYYLVNGITKFDLFLFHRYVRDVQHIICDEWDFMVRDINRSKNGNYSIIAQKQATFIESAEILLDQFVYSDSFKADDIESVYKIFNKTLDTLCNECLSVFFKTEVNEAKKNRVLSYLRVGEDFNGDFDAILFVIREKFERLISKKKNNLYNSLHARNISDWYDLVSYEYSEYDTPPVSFQIEEDGVELCYNDSLSTIYKLNKAIYIDTPMAVSSGFDENYFWNELRDLMFTSKESMLSSDVALFTRRIKDTIKGEAKLIDDINDDRELRFVSEDGKVDIELSKAATGVKTFTYLQRLLQNGFLNESTLLLIDEPEAHLHPQWIVEFARLLVLLNKNLGVKIMLASHNPDMVSAIRYISEKEGILDVTRFYLAENIEHSHQYIYKDLANDISDVFSSFNIALDRINQYGTNNN